MALFVANYITLEFEIEGIYMNKIFKRKLNMRGNKK